MKIYYEGMRKNKYSYSQLIHAKDHSIYNRDDLYRSIICGCYHCVTIFFSSEIREWKDNNQTGICPFCKEDSLLDKSSEYPLGKDFLLAMKKYWYN